MTDMTAFERRVAAGMLQRAGPSRPVDDLAIYEAVAAASRPRSWGLKMYSALKFVTAGVIVALFGGVLLTGILSERQRDEAQPAEATASPTTEAVLTTAPTTEVYRFTQAIVRDVPGQAAGQTSRQGKAPVSRLWRVRRYTGAIAGPFHGGVASRWSQAPRATPFPRGSGPDPATLDPVPSPAHPPIVRRASDERRIQARRQHGGSLPSRPPTAARTLARRATIEACHETPRG
jgi:hypothetical protein